MSLTTRLDVDPSAADVRFDLYVRNTGDSPIEVEFRSPMEAEVTVFRDGEECWRSSEGEMYAQVLHSRMFSNGHEELLQFDWMDPEPGEYEAVAELNVVTDGINRDDVTARATFSV